MALVQLLERLEADCPVWCFDGQCLTAASVRTEVCRYRHWLQPLAGSRVSLHLQDPLQALLCMLALDGVASSVFLVPGSFGEQPYYAEIEQQYGGEFNINEYGLAYWLSRSAGGETVAETRETEWVLATSGTTGVPKLIAHTASSLLATAQKNTLRGGEFTWGLVFEPFRFAGLQVVLQALAGGSKLVICDPRASIVDHSKIFVEAGVNALSATPTYWRKVLFGGFLQGHPLRQITLGGETADQPTLDALACTFPGARIVHIYASTETGVAFSVADGLAGFPVAYLQAGANGKALTIDARGTLRVGRENQDTGDLVEIRDGRVLFAGRRSGIINVGGNKVSPEQVEAVIREVSGVAEVLVKGKANSVTGQIVIAEVVPNPADTDIKALRKIIMEHCKQCLTTYAVPALIRFTQHIETNPSGKASRMT